MASDWLMKWTTTGGNVFTIPVVNMRITLTKEAKTNSAEIVVQKKYAIENGDIRFNPGEKLSIYAKNGGLINYSSPDVADLVGVFTILNYEVMPDDSMVKLVCSDLTYSLLSQLFTRDIIESEGYTSASLISKIVQETHQPGDTQYGLTTDIATTKHDGTSFPVVKYSSLWKTSYDCINELSNEEYTGDDKPYMFYIDSSGTFHWEYPSATLETLNLNNLEKPVLTMKYSRVESETVNMVIYDAGTDLNGDQILDFYLKPNAGTIDGATRYYPMTDIARDLKFDGSITDNNLFVQAVKNAAVSRAKRIVDRIGQGLDKATIDILGQKVNIAKLHNVVSDMRSSKSLRLIRVVHTIDRTGWNTRLELEEDPTYN